MVDNKGAVFIALPALGMIDRIDAATKQITASWNISPCTGPAALAIDTASRELFTTCEDRKLVSISADTGMVIAIGEAPAGSGDIDFNPRDNCLFLADAAGTVTVFHRDQADTFSIFQQIKTRPAHGRWLSIMTKIKFSLSRQSLDRTPQRHPKSYSFGLRLFQAPSLSLS